MVQLRSKSPTATKTQPRFNPQQIQIHSTLASTTSAKRSSIFHVTEAWITCDNVSKKRPLIFHVTEAWIPCDKLF